MLVEDEFGGGPSLYDTRDLLGRPHRHLLRCPLCGGAELLADIAPDDIVAAARLLGIDFGSADR